MTVFRVRHGVQRPHLQIIDAVRENLRDRRQQLVRLQQHLVIVRGRLAYAGPTTQPVPRTQYVTVERERVSDICRPMGRGNCRFHVFIKLRNVILVRGLANGSINTNEHTREGAGKRIRQCVKKVVGQKRFGDRGKFDKFQNGRP